MTNNMLAESQIQVFKSDSDPESMLEDLDLYAKISWRPRGTP